MNIGILGTGMIANMMIPEFQRTQTLRCRAVLSRTEEKGRALAQKFGIPKVYTALEELLADPDISMVYVASPNSVHFSQAKAALLAGKHVICEKPFTPTLAETEELIALAKEKHLLLFEAITTAHHPNYLRLKEHISRLGSLKLVSCTYCQYSSRYPALMGGNTAPAFDPAYCGGALMDLNLYNIHFVVGLFGLPEKVHYYPNLHSNGVDTSGILILEYPGFICQCTGAKDCAAENGVQILGDKGAIKVQAAGNNCKHVEILPRNETPEVFETSENPWYYEVQDICRLIEKEDYEVCYDLLETTRQVVAVLEAARKDAGLDY